MAPVNERRGATALNIGAALHNYSRQYGAGRALVETGYRLLNNPDTVRGPDVSFNLRPRQAGEATRVGFVPGSPDIAVGVVSPSNTAAELPRKVAEYLGAGSQRVWVVYTPTNTTPRRVLVHRLDGTVVSYTNDDIMTDEELLPGFSLPLTEIFD